MLCNPQGMSILQDNLISFCHLHHAGCFFLLYVHMRTFDGIWQENFDGA